MDLSLFKEEGLLIECLSKSLIDENKMIRQKIKNKYNLHCDKKSKRFYNSLKIEHAL